MNHTKEEKLPLLLLPLGLSDGHETGVCQFYSRGDYAFSGRYIKYGIFKEDYPTKPRTRRDNWVLIYKGGQEDNDEKRRM